MFPRKPHKVRHNQVIINEPLVRDNIKFHVIAGLNFRSDFAIQAPQTFFRHAFEIGDVIFPGGRSERGNQIRVCKRMAIALVRNHPCVGNGLWQIRKQRRHFRSGLVIKLVSFKAHAVPVTHFTLGSNAHQSILHRGIFMIKIVNIVGGHQFDL